MLFPKIHCQRYYRMNKKKPYKEPVFLFTSSSLRFAAWAGWYSALGDKEKTEQWIHQAHTEWIKEIGAMRRFSFLNTFNHEMWSLIPPERLRTILNVFFRTLKLEIKKRKSTLRENKRNLQQ